jgi:hypothetical protein
MVFHLPTFDSAATSLGIVRIYEGDAGSQLSVEPFTNLLPRVGNLGGSRSVGRGQDKKFVVLYSSGQDEDWSDVLDLNTGISSTTATIRRLDTSYTIRHLAASSSCVEYSSCCIWRTA